MSIHRFTETEQFQTIIISLLNDAKSMKTTRHLLTEITVSGSNKYIKNPYIMNASTPITAGHDLLRAMTEKNVWKWDRSKLLKTFQKMPTRTAEIINYTWPITSDQNRLDLSTGLYYSAYRANDYLKVVACTISHLRCWMHSIIYNTDVLVLEHDVRFVKPFYPKTIYDANKSFGIVSINDPRKATRQSHSYHYQLSEGFKRDQNNLQPVPTVNGPGDNPVPQGLPGNSAYIIQPWAAKLVIAKMCEVGVWPNDALMCKEFFPWMKCVYPYMTSIQTNVTSSTTT